MAKDEVVRKSLDIPKKALSALAKDAIDADTTTKGYLEKILIVTAQKSKNYKND